MPIPLNKLAGAELLPQRCELKTMDLSSMDIGYNEAVDDLGICAISIDEYELSVAINETFSLNLPYYEMMSDIASKAEKFLKIVRVSDEVKS